jgi:hypothetical protein
MIYRGGALITPREIKAPLHSCPRLSTTESSAGQQTHVDTELQQWGKRGPEILIQFNFN